MWFSPRRDCKFQKLKRDGQMFESPAFNVNLNKMDAQGDAYQELTGSFSKDAPTGSHWRSKFHIHYH